MPKALHDALARAGRKKGYKGKRLDAFVYGAMTNTMKKGKKESALAHAIRTGGRKK